ncbi:hypothetical protein [Mycobacterium sp. 852002-40037_SCH5390672]|uniref:hypothetical protein n=1 Tax=Mycobacterium sp. 852002-40037_SCH5390672 TaxID=1834089 RepID=UPI0008060358|nr:hypothetical protein [Mycobacterium sp. 852002-40037_SCH5390672]OBB99072.1 hypothetical protein A5782_22535 [Mycobacterium sp. 852002-40037_SCH5390672]
MTEMATEGIGVRPELIKLDTVAHHRVLEQVTAKGGHCEACGATDFAVGDALYLGYLFLNEDADAYMVALTCRNPDCPKPRTALRLRDRDFLTYAGGASDASGHDDHR